MHCSLRWCNGAEGFGTLLLMVADKLLLDVQDWSLPLNLRDVRWAIARGDARRAGLDPNAVPAPLLPVAPAPVAPTPAGPHGLPQHLPVPAPMRSQRTTKRAREVRSGFLPLGVLAPTPSPSPCACASGCTPSHSPV